MSKPANVISYYILCNKLKDLIRSGWTKWHVRRERLESVAEHAHPCDKLETDIQCKLYDEENCVDWQRETDNELLKDPRVQAVADFDKSWSDCWITCDQDLNFYDSNFVEVLEYLKASHI